MSVAGIVIYEINPDGSLDGRWTHAATGGRAATEHASGGTPGMLQGTYQVVVKNVDKTLLFDGSLTIKQLGEAYSLDWSGNLVSPNRRPAQFTGIGLLQGRDTLAATFQETAEGDVRQKIEQANAEFGRAFANGDAKAVAGLYTPTAELFPPNAAIVQGRDAIQAFWQAAIASGMTQVTLSTAEVESLGDTAVETGTAILESSHPANVGHGKYVVIWKQAGGAWLLHRDCWNSSDPSSLATS